MEEVNVGNIVNEITGVLSTHLTRIIAHISDNKDAEVENIKILNQLPLVQKLKKENEMLIKMVASINKKYKSCLEELIIYKKQDCSKQVIMEITEINDNPNLSVTSEEISSTVKNIYTSDQNNLLNLWGMDTDTSESNNDLLSDNDDDDDAREINFKYKKYAKTTTPTASENILCDQSVREAALVNWKLFYNNDNRINKSDKELLCDIINSAAGIKAWATMLDNIEEDEEEEDEEEDEDEEEEDEEAEEEDEDEAEVEAEVEDEAEEEDEGEEDGEDDDSGYETTELEEIKLDGKIYYTEDSLNGSLYECLEDEEIGDIIGHLENGTVFFS